MDELKIGKYTIEKPIIQGGMGVGLSWDQLAGNVSKEGGLGVISSVGTGYYKYPRYLGNIKNDRPNSKNFCSDIALKEIFRNARKICGDKPLACNIMYALSGYADNVKAACEAGVDIIITGAGIPTNMPEFTKEFPDVALVPIVSSARALKLICKKWKKYDKVPDAVIVEGPLSGGHQGFKYEDCFKNEFQLENLIPEVIEEAEKWGEIPVIAAGGIWDKNDIDKFLDLGSSGVQMGTRFIATHECDAPHFYKIELVNLTEDRIKLGESPVGLPSRRFTTNIHKLIEQGNAPEIKCISNCVSPCKHGEKAKEVGYCIADRLADAVLGNFNTGLFFTGAYGYRINEIISVKQLMDKLVNGE